MKIVALCRKLLLCVTLLLLGCVGARPAFGGPHQQNTGFIDQAINSVVAVSDNPEINDGEDSNTTMESILRLMRAPEHNTSCTGFWISSHEIMTAYHCVQPQRILSVSLDPQGLGGTMMAAAVIPADDQAIGAVLYYHTHNNPLWRPMRVVAVDRAIDLALLRVVRDPPRHQWVTLAPTAIGIRRGARVWMLGHPLGIEYTYSTGYIGRVARTPTFMNSDGLLYSRRQINQGRVPHRLTIQAQAPGMHGSSGSPLFDNYGHLIGLCIIMLPEAPWMMVSVHHRHLQQFLNRWGQR